jgi:hypothetical protein
MEKAKAKGKKKEEQKAEVQKVEQKAADNFVKMSATNGSLNKYGKRNCLSHGRLAQGGQIDQLVFKSFLTGKAVSFEECAALNLKEAVSNPLTLSRIDAHLQHLMGKHGMKIDINSQTKTFTVKDVGTLDKATVKQHCDIVK